MFFTIATIVAGGSMNLSLDKYAKDWELWHRFATINYTAAIRLFETDDPLMWFPAATLGHYALEMHLKAVLILNGMTVFDPRKVKRLDPSIGLAKSDCFAGGGVLATRGAFQSSGPSPVLCYSYPNHEVSSLPYGFRRELLIQQRGAVPGGDIPDGPNHCARNRMVRQRATLPRMPGHDNLL